MAAASLREMDKDKSLRIVSVGAEGEMGRRLRDMGILPGATCMVIGRAPLRDPVALRIRDFTLTLRNNEADHIQVEEV